jgi:excinuclease ABC subunit B
MTRADLSDPPAADAGNSRREKREGGRRLVLRSDFSPAGDQPTAIAELVGGLATGERNQVLLGATGTGKTFTMAKVIEAVQKPTLVIAP